MRLSIFLIVCAAGAPIWAQYTGPAILSRGEAPAAMSAKNISFRPFFEIAGVYDTGLTDARLSDSGGLATGRSFGVRGAAGVSGAKSWKSTTIGVDYWGSYTSYDRQTVPRTFAQGLLFAFSRRLTRHLYMDVRQSAGMFTRDFGLAGLSQTVAFDPASTATPTTDYFDNRTYYSTTQAYASLQKSTRLSFHWGGGYFINNRSSKSLYSVKGASAQGDMQYRVSRSSTIGAVYMYNRYAFSQTSGDSHIHLVAGSYSVRPTRRFEFSIYAGMARVESKFLLARQVDPVIAELLGIRATSQIVHTIVRRPYVEGRLSRTFAKGIAYISGGMGITPGNGIFLTSYTNRIVGGYTYTGLRRWSFGAQAGDMWAQSTGNVNGRYGGVTGLLTFSRSLWGSAHLMGSFAIRQYQSGDYELYNRLIYNASIGLRFTPGNLPIRIR